ncbi:MAG: type IX secretion system membrane protein PorP/SprF [Bacteroidales bacterium]|nr:type IX secretion system membrane protein PorP/SprF [Bacteroidales bacterium]
MKLLKYILPLLLITGIVQVQAQQIQMYSQYMLNDFAFNPAITGTHEYYQARLNNRYQWSGIVDAPKTYILSIYGPHKKQDMGFGGMVYNDVTGPTSRTGFQGAYAYNIRIQNDIRLSFGLSAGLLQFKIDGSKITWHDDGDYYNEVMYVDYVPDATFGMYLYSNTYYAGFSTGQLLGGKVKLYDNVYNETLTQGGLNRLKNHFFLMGGYKYKINDDFLLEPGFLIKKMAPTPYEFEINLKTTYKNMVWLGFSFRTHEKSMPIMIGYNYENQMYFGYSYDLIFSDLKNYTSGTHEIMVVARFNKIKQSKTRPKI